MRKVHVIVQDDIDGSEPAQTVHFALDGEAYEIDLSEEHAAALRDALAPWIAAARRTPTTPEPPLPAESQGSPDTVDIRRWAKENGIPVRERGRISIDLRNRYEAAH
jgi:hypothetical protein